MAASALSGWVHVRHARDVLVDWEKRWLSVSKEADRDAGYVLTVWSDEDQDTVETRVPLGTVTAVEETTASAAGLGYRWHITTTSTTLVLLSDSPEDRERWITGLTRLRQASSGPGLSQEEIERRYKVVLFRCGQLTRENDALQRQLNALRLGADGELVDVAELRRQLDSWRAQYEELVAEAGMFGAPGAFGTSQDEQDDAAAPTPQAPRDDAAPVGTASAAASTPRLRVSMASKRSGSGSRSGSNARRSMASRRSGRSTNSVQNLVHQLRGELDAANALLEREREAAARAQRDLRGAQQFVEQLQTELRLEQRRAAAAASARDGSVSGEAEAQLADLRAAMATAEARVVQEQAERAAAEERYRVLQQQHLAVSRDLKQAYDDAKKHAESNVLQLQLDEAVRELNAARLQIASLEAELEQRQATHRDTVAAKLRLQELEQEVQSATRQCVDAEENARGAQRVAKQMEEEKDALAVQVEESQEAQHEMQRRMQEADEDFAEAMAKVHRLEKANGKLRAQLDDVLVQLGEERAMVERLQNNARQRRRHRSSSRRTGAREPLLTEAGDPGDSEAADQHDDGGDAAAASHKVSVGTSLRLALRRCACF